MRYTIATLAVAFALSLAAMGCDSPNMILPLPEPEPVEDGPCSVVLTVDDAPALEVASGNFACDGDTLLFCGCRSYADDGATCADDEHFGDGIYVAQALVDDCTCGDWFAGRCPVE